MHPRPFMKHDELKNDTYESLKEEYDGIKNDIWTINNMNVSDEAKQIVLKELNEQINEVKERMHNCIDKL